MSIAVRFIHRCQRIIVHNDHIRRSALFQYTKLFSEITVRNLCISLKQHLWHFSPCSSRITEIVFVQNVSNLPGFHHIMCIPICSQSCQNSFMYQFHRWRTSTCISHIRFRIMHNHGICFFDQLHLMFIYVNTMSQKCFRTKDIPIIQPVYNSLIVFFQALM